MANSPLDRGNLPPVPDQVLLESATVALLSALRKGCDALCRACDNAEQACYNATAREYTAKQLVQLRKYVAEAEGLLVEHGCTIDLDADADPAHQDAQIDVFLDRIFGAPKGGEA